MKIKDSVRNSLVGLSCFVSRRQQSKVFSVCMSFGGRTGPSRFLVNLQRAFDANGIRFTRFDLGACRSALIMHWNYLNQEKFYHLCRKRKVRTVARVDGIYWNKTFLRETSKRSLENQFLYNRKMAYDLLNADYVIYQSVYSKQMCDSYIYPRSDNYQISYNGVDIQLFQRTGNVCADDVLKVLIFGSFRDADLLKCELDCFARIAAFIPAKLTIAGPFIHPSVAEIYDEWVCQNRNLMIYVERKSYVSYLDLPNLFNAHDLMLHLKIGDWCPNAVVEAMACGLPVVCHATGGTVEIVGDCGLIIPDSLDTHDENLSSAAADMIVAHVDKVPDLGLHAETRIRESFSLESMASSYASAMGLR